MSLPTETGLENSIILQAYDGVTYLGTTKENVTQETFLVSRGV